MTTSTPPARPVRIDRAAPPAPKRGTMHGIDCACVDHTAPRFCPTPAPAWWARQHPGTPAPPARTFSEFARTRFDVR